MRQGHPWVDDCCIGSAIVPLLGSDGSPTHLQGLCVEAARQWLLLQVTPEADVGAPPTGPTPPARQTHSSIGMVA